MFVVHRLFRVVEPYGTAWLLIMGRQDERQWRQMVRKPPDSLPPPYSPSMPCASGPVLLEFATVASPRGVVLLSWVLPCWAKNVWFLQFPRLLRDRRGP